MSRWNHRICERCWFDGPGLLGPEEYRLPVQIKQQEPGYCCFCRGLTVTGIFMRRDPATLNCADLPQHEEIEDDDT